MVRKIIKISEMDTSDHIHDVMGSFLELPRYYGRNFDALFDVLTDISERTDIAIDYEGKTLREIPACALTGLRVLFDAAMVTPALRIVKPEDIAAGEAAEAVTAAEPVVESRTAVGSEVIAEVPAESEDAFESEIDVEIVIEPEAVAEMEDEFEMAADTEPADEPDAES